MFAYHDYNELCEDKAKITINWPTLLISKQIKKLM